MPADTQLADRRAGTGRLAPGPGSPITAVTGSALYLPYRPQHLLSRLDSGLQPGLAVLAMELHKQLHLNSKAEGAVEIPFPLKETGLTFSELRICKALKLS